MCTITETEIIKDETFVVRFINVVYDNYIIKYTHVLVVLEISNDFPFKWFQIVVVTWLKTN